MNVNVRHLVTALLIISLIACKKQSGQPGGSQNNNNNNNGGVQQGNYSGQKLTLSTAEKVVSPWVEISEDSVYSSYGALSSLFKTIPTGFDDKIVSFYLPKGYLAVFAANPDGTGESACFVALDNPIKANLPARLRNNISYIRYIKFNNPEKKGTCSTSDAVVQSFGAQWHYTWAINKPSFTNQQFVPMTWGKGTCTDDNAKYLIERKDVDHMLSFNEPDHATQSNVPVDTAIVRYKIMQKTGLRLGSPVTTQDQAFGAGKWLTDFMAKAQAISGAKLAAKVGKVLEVIVDEVDEDGATCRTKADAPEIDGNLFIDEGFEALAPGDIVSVEVDEAGEYDLWGRLA